MEYAAMTLCVLTKRSFLLSIENDHAFAWIDFMGIYMTKKSLNLSPYVTFLEKSNRNCVRNKWPIETVVVTATEVDSSTIPKKT